MKAKNRLLFENLMKFGNFWDKMRIYITKFQWLRVLNRRRRRWVCNALMTHSLSYWNAEVNWLNYLRAHKMRMRSLPPSVVTIIAIALVSCLVFRSVIVSHPISAMCRKSLWYEYIQQKIEHKAIECRRRSLNQIIVSPFFLSSNITLTIISTSQSSSFDIDGIYSCNSSSA